MAIKKTGTAHTYCLSVPVFLLFRRAQYSVYIKLPLFFLKFKLLALEKQLFCRGFSSDFTDNIGLQMGKQL